MVVLGSVCAVAILLLLVVVPQAAKLLSVACLHATAPPFFKHWQLKIEYSDGIRWNGAKDHMKAFHYFARLTGERVAGDRRRALAAPAGRRIGILQTYACAFVTTAFFRGLC